uniref:Leuk-A4-hydro_C domain-containing protein n=1 Tax=Haemonchus contortus TaxID=6289 RepID=A0A7I4YHZ2_HAECO
MRPRRDPCSAANNHDIIVTHTAIKWDVTFQLRMLIGQATLECTMIRKTDKLLLDVRDLSIRSVTVDGKVVDFRIAPNAYTFFGSKMTVYLPKDVQEDGGRLSVVILYSTSPDATALQWMKKEQTADKKAPYLFSQCQAIHARSIVPCMDTPSVKSTYEAQVTVPAGLTCLMSAIGEGSKGDDEFTTFFFKQPVAIPSYLIAIVVGALEKRDISERVAVWAEPSVVDKAHWEFSETEDILSCAEEIAGKYIWGRYDMVCLPPSFPFGGMENPCLTFLTPTLIAGDRSLVSVIAHEIAHSWSGNLVTNSSWEHFWLNEGFTMFIERKICGRLVSEDYRQFMSFNGWTNNLIPAVYEQFTPTHQFTKLIQDHTNVDPDVAFSCVPYEKGSALLFYLEQKLGGSEIFEAYLRDYLTTFAHKAIDSHQWKKHLYEYFQDKTDILNAVDFDAWFHAVGMPPEKPNYGQAMVIACEALFKQWIEADEVEVNNINTDSFKAMQPLQQIEFISQLWQHDPPLEHWKLTALDRAYGLNDSENSEIVFKWIRLCVKAKWEPIIDKALRFISSQGRLKFCRPVYRDLSAWPAAKTRARDQYIQTRSSMHPITAEMIAKDLHMRHSTHTVCF